MVYNSWQNFRTNIFGIHTENCCGNFTFLFGLFRGPMENDNDIPKILVCSLDASTLQLTNLQKYYWKNVVIGLPELVSCQKSLKNLTFSRQIFFLKTFNAVLSLMVATVTQS